MSNVEFGSDFWERFRSLKFCPECSHPMAKTSLPIVLDEKGMERIVTKPDEIAAVRESGAGIWSDFFVCPNCEYVTEDDPGPDFLDNLLQPKPE